MGRSRPTQPERAPAPSPQPFWTVSRLVAAIGVLAAGIGLLAMCFRSSVAGSALQLAGGVAVGFGESHSGVPAGSAFVEKVPEYTLDLTRPPFVPDTKCPNVFVFRTIPAGLGHRIASFALAVAGALGSNAAVAIEAGVLVLQRQHEDKEDYPFIKTFFNLGGFAAVHDEGAVARLPWGVTQQAHTNIYKAQAGARSSCGVAYEYATGFMGCNERRRRLGAPLPSDEEEGESAPLLDTAVAQRPLRAPRGLYCMMKSHPRALQNASAIMRPLFNAGNYSKRPVPLYATAHAASPRALTVAWHVRNGDTRQHENPEIYQKVHAMLARAAAASKVPLTHVVFAQHEITADGKNGYAFLPTLPEFAGVPFPRPPIDEVLLHLVRSDVLVHAGGSSFSYVAALVAPPTQIGIAPPPKEKHPGGNPDADDMYFMDGTFRVSTTGELLLPAEAEEARLAEAIRVRYAAVTGRRGN